MRQKIPGVVLMSMVLRDFVRFSARKSLLGNVCLFLLFVSFFFVLLFYLCMCALRVCGRKNHHEANDGKDDGGYSCLG